MSDAAESIDEDEDVDVADEQDAPADIDIPLDTRKIPVRFHHLAAMKQSSAHAYDSLIADGGATRSMERGTSVHALVFETVTVVANPFKVRKGKEYMKWAADYDGCRIVTKKEYETSNRMADAIRANAFAMQVLTGERELTRLFDLDGRLCRATPDCVGETWISDLKTSVTADPKRWPYEMRKWNYHAVCAWYRSSCAKQDCYVVAAEAERPWPVTVFKLKESALAVGEQMVMTWFEQFRQCEDSGVWPAYASEIVDLDLPQAAAWEAA